MIDFLIVSLPIIVAVGSFGLGFHYGKRSRKIRLEGWGTKRAFATFLEHEIERHISDIDRARCDLEKLKEMGISPAKTPDHLWYEV